MKRPLVPPQESLLSARMVAGALLGVCVIAVVLAWRGEEPPAPSEDAAAAAPATAKRGGGSDWLFGAWRREPASAAAPTPAPTATPSGQGPLFLPPLQNGNNEAPKAIRPDGTLSTAHWSTSRRWVDRRTRPSPGGKLGSQPRAPAPAARSNEAAGNEDEFEDDQAFEAWWNEPEPGDSDLAAEEDEADREFEEWWAADE